MLNTAKTERGIAVCLAWIAFIYFLQFFVLGHIVGPWDFDHLSSYYQLAWLFWQRADAIFPDYNPLFCGGRTLGGDPQIPIYSPLTLLVPVLGPARLLKWEMFFQFVAGFAGVVAWLRHFRLSRPQVLWGSFLFLSCGAVVAKFMVGHVTLGYYILFPLILYLGYLAEERTGRAKCKVLFFYWLTFVYCGLYKPNFLIYGVPSLFFEALFRSIFTRRFTPLLWLGMGALWCGGINAVSYLPAREYFSDFPRPDDAPGKFIPPYSFFANLIFPLKAVPEFLYGSVFLQRHEYNLFVGPVALLFAFLGARKIRNPKSRALWWSALLSVWMGFGAIDGGWHPALPFTWLRPIWPGFASIRVPVRFWFFAILPIVLYSAAGLPGLKKKSHTWAFLLLGLFPLVANVTVNLCKTSFLADPQIQAHSQAEVRGYYLPRWPEKWVEGSPVSMLGDTRKGNAILDCADNLQAFRAPDLKPGPVLPTQLPVPGTIQLLAWMGWNEIAISVHGDTPFTLQLNLNHSNYWHFHGSYGKIVSKNYQKLAVEADDRKIQGVLVYEQPKVGAGLAISASTLFIFLMLGGFSFWRKRVRVPDGTPTDIEPRMRQMISQMMKLFLFITAGITLGSGIRREWNALSILTWKPTPLTFLKTEIFSDEHNIKDAPPFHLEVEYQYPAGDIFFKSRIWTPREPLLSLQELRHKETIFQRKIAYVNPFEASEAVLEKDFASPLSSLLATLALSLCFVALALSDPNSSRRVFQISAALVLAWALFLLPQIREGFSSTRAVTARVKRAEVRYYWSRPFLNVLFEAEGKSYSDFFYRSNLQELYELKKQYTPGTEVPAQLDGPRTYLGHRPLWGTLGMFCLKLALAAGLFFLSKKLHLYRASLNRTSSLVAKMVSKFARTNYATLLALIPLLAVSLISLYAGKKASGLLFDEVSTLSQFTVFLLNGSLVALALLTVLAFSATALLVNILLGRLLETPTLEAQEEPTLPGLD